VGLGHSVSDAVLRDRHPGDEHHAMAIGAPHHAPTVDHRRALRHVRVCEQLGLRRHGGTVPVGPKKRTGLGSHPAGPPPDGEPASMSGGLDSVTQPILGRRPDYRIPLPGGATAPRPPRKHPFVLFMRIEETAPLDVSVDRTRISPRGGMKVRHHISAHEGTRGTGIGRMTS
jgi:hypothetical protein